MFWTEGHDRVQVMKSRHILNADVVYKCGVE